MAKHRNRKQKQITALRRKLQFFKNQTISPSNATKNSFTPPVDAKTVNPTSFSRPIDTKKPPDSPISLYFYDPIMIKKDLKKTALGGVLFALVLGAVYYLIELNGLNTIRSLLPF